MAVRVQREAFDVGVELARLHAENHAVGAIATFIGTVRDLGSENDLSLTLEHYPGMTEKAIEAIIDEAAKRFEIIDCLVIHRIGTLLAGESIVLVAVTSAHRAQAFSGCEFVMDFLKTQAPFWKKEKSAAGSHWVESRASDDTAARRWHEPGE